MSAPSEATIRQAAPLDAEAVVGILHEAARWLEGGGREMWKIDEDLTGENYCGGGYCSEHMNMRRYGDKAKGQPNCQNNLETAIKGYGMDRWNFNVDACFNVFMTVGYDADGKWEIRLPKGKPGDYMTMTALMPQIVAISNCPILFNPCNNYKLKPLTVEILP